jgi:endo-1,4-beta-xylanase
MPRRLLALLILLLGLPVLAGAQPADPCTLRSLAERTAVRIGAFYGEGSQTAEFRAVHAREFDSLTAGLYWSVTEPAQGSFHFAAPDAAVAFAEANGQRVRGHPLVWGRLALPAWVNTITSADDLRTAMTEHIRTVMQHYAGRVAQYDVVNEPLTVFGDAGDTDGLENYVFLRLLGPGYIADALRSARAADPHVRLFVNEFGVERPGPKQDRFFRLVHDLLRDGAPLDGVGFQTHVALPILGGPPPAAGEIEAAMRRFTALGVQVELTEMDVVLPDRSPCQLDWQRGVYHGVLAACLRVAGCTGLTVWAISDAYTWIRDFFGVDGAPLLFDESFLPKPAYFGVRAALREAACPAGGCPAPCSTGEPVLDPVESATCPCRVALPSPCAGDALPAAVARHIAGACARLEPPPDATTGAGRRALTRAATRWKRARHALAKLVRAGGADAACADALAVTLADARARARAARGGR